MHFTSAHPPHSPQARLAASPDLAILEARFDSLRPQTKLNPPLSRTSRSVPLLETTQDLPTVQSDQWSGPSPPHIWEEWREITRFFVLSNYTEIQRWLLERHHLMEVIATLRHVLPVFFEDQIQLRVDLFLAYEDGSYDSSDQAVVLVSTRLEPTQANECLRLFDERWWLRQPAEYRNAIIVDLEYV